MPRIPFSRRALCLALAGGTLGFVGGAAATVRFDEKTRVFRLDGGEATYAFGVDAEGRLQSLHWGGRVADDDIFGPPVPNPAPGLELPSGRSPEEFPGWGAGLFTEPTLKLAFADGVRDLVLRYASHRIEDGAVRVTLKDILREVRVELVYSMDAQTGVLARSATVENGTGQALRIDQIGAAAFTLPSGDYDLHYLTGRWWAEWQLQTRPISPGATVLESRRGETSQQNNPWFAITGRNASDEETGPAWFGALAWSGAWRISVDQDSFGEVRIVGGYNPFDFAYVLQPGGRLETPVFYAGYSAQGLGGASRVMHRFQRTRILPGAPSPKLRPILYNSWEATIFAVDEAGQIALAEKAAEIGVERFVVDDGWFGARDTDRAGLGDWVVNRRKFPNGLKPLIDRVHALGMDFGLWVEPEMVNRDSDLYRAHPDWTLNFPGRPQTEARNQLVLNLARPEVRDYLLKVLDALLTDNDIQCLKWDHNRSWSEPGWPEVAPDQQQRIYVDYVRNLYWMLAELRRRHPKLEIESCASGGGRVDLGIMGLTDQVWPSDNTDAFDRLSIQDGFTYAYAPAVMMAWVTDSPNGLSRRSTSLEYRFLSAMQGGLGVGANLAKWGAPETATAKRLVAEYKAIRRTVQQGDLYRLISPRGGSARSATLSVAPDRS